MQINVLKKIKGSVCCVRKEVRESLVIGYSPHSPPRHYESHTSKFEVGALHVPSPL